MSADRRFLTARDAEVLAWVGEMYGVRQDVLAVLLGRRRPAVGLGAEAAPGPLSYRSTRDVVARWEQAGWVHRRRLFAGRVWIVPTARGLDVGRRADQDKPFDAWEPAGVTLAHVHACALVRLHVEAFWPEAAWRSERVLRRLHRLEREARGTRERDRQRIPDGEVMLADPETGERMDTAVEVELTVKDTRRYGEIVQAYGHSYKALWWFTPEASTGRLLALLAQAGAHHLPAGGSRRIQVDPLPDVPGLSYEALL